MISGKIFWSPLVKLVDYLLGLFKNEKLLKEYGRPIRIKEAEAKPLSAKLGN